MNQHRREAWDAIQRYLARRERERAYHADAIAQRRAMIGRESCRWLLTPEDARFLRALGVDPR